jgi:hypothetical protein
MNNIIDEFQKYGENLPETIGYIKRFGLEGELDNILTTYKDTELCDNLFKFGFKYGILSIVKFLYEVVNHPYEVGIFNDFIAPDNSKKKEEVVATNLVTVGDDAGAGDSDPLRFTIGDKYSKGRNECINYLIGMKKYSTYFSKNKKFWYRYRKEKYG